MSEEEATITNPLLHRHPTVVGPSVWVPRAVPDSIRSLLDIAVLGHLGVNAVYVGACKPRAVCTEPLKRAGGRLAGGVDENVLSRCQKAGLGEGGGHDGEGCRDRFEARHGVVLNERTPEGTKIIGKIKNYSTKTPVSEQDVGLGIYDIYHINTSLASSTQLSAAVVTSPSPCKQRRVSGPEPGFVHYTRIVYACDVFLPEEEPRHVVASFLAVRAREQGSILVREVRGGAWRPVGISEIGAPIENL